MIRRMGSLWPWKSKPSDSSELSPQQDLLPEDEPAIEELTEIVLKQLLQKKEFTILDLAEKVIEMTGSDSIIDLKPLPQDDPAQRQPDITLAKDKLNWEPEVNLEEGLVKTIKYFKKIVL